MESALDGALKLISIGALEVREDGSIWKLAIRTRSGQLKQIQPKRAEHKGKRGYLLINVHTQGRQKALSAHRLVWTFFRGAIPAGHDINHIDGNKLNNSLANLETLTRSENIKHAYRLGLNYTPGYDPALKERARTLRGQGLTLSAIAASLGISKSSAFKFSRA